MVGPAPSRARPAQTKWRTAMKHLLSGALIIAAIGLWTASEAQAAPAYTQTVTVSSSVSGAVVINWTKTTLECGNWPTPGTNTGIGVACPAGAAGQATATANPSGAPYYSSATDLNNGN